MPELPDVEVFKRYFQSTSLHKKIQDTEVLNRKVLERVSEKDLVSLTKNRSFENADRYGKYLIAEMDNSSYLVLHFGMTGRLEYLKDRDELPSHSRVVFHFDNGYHLAYDCQRLLGRVYAGDEKDRYLQEKDLGIDAMSISYEQFYQIVEGSRSSVKSLLMDQSKIAGIGNIYSDEVFFQARIHPKRPCKELQDGEIRLLYEKMNEVIDTAIEIQADPNRMPSHFLLPHRDPEDKCPVCGGSVQKISISNRSSYLCPRCQK